MDLYLTLKDLLSSVFVGQLWDQEDYSHLEWICPTFFQQSKSHWIWPLKHTRCPTRNRRWLPLRPSHTKEPEERKIHHQRLKKGSWRKATRGFTYSIMKVGHKVIDRSLISVVELGFRQSFYTLGKIHVFGRSFGGGNGRHSQHSLIGLLSSFVFFVTGGCIFPGPLESVLRTAILSK